MYVVAALLVAFWVVEPKRLYRDLRAGHQVQDWPLPTSPVVAMTTTSGLTVNVPNNPKPDWRTGAWNPPLVTTPYFDPGLQERVPGDPRHGFRTTTPAARRNGIPHRFEGYVIP